MWMVNPSRLGFDAPVVAHQRVDEVELDIGPVEFAARFEERACVQVDGAAVPVPLSMYSRPTIVCLRPFSSV